MSRSGEFFEQEVEVDCSGFVRTVGRDGGVVVKFDVEGIKRNQDLPDLRSCLPTLDFRHPSTRYAGSPSKLILTPAAGKPC
jgi:hypothetical protein